MDGGEEIHWVKGTEGMGEKRCVRGKDRIDETGGVNLKLENSMFIQLGVWYSSRIRGVFFQFFCVLTPTVEMAEN